MSQPRGYTALFSRGTRRSFTFPQVDVDDAADQGEWKGHPGQGEAVAEAASAWVLCQDLLSVDGIDQCPGEHSRTCGTTNSRVGAGRATQGAALPSVLSGLREPPPPLVPNCSSEK